jgi:sulfate transport system permease protein
MTIDKVKQGKKQSWVPTILIGVAISYLFLVQYIPAINVFFEAFKKGSGPFLSNLTKPEFLHAAWLTLLLAVISIPLNAVFGLCAAWAIARHKFPGRAIVLSIIDLPFSISPVVAGMVMATAFVSMPFVAREVIPILEEFGKDQEEAARTLGANDWQIFWRVTLPSIRWGLLYGLILTNARAMGEFGAVSVVSGNIANTTQSLPLFVEDAYKQYETEAAFSAAVILALLAVVTLILKEIIERKTRIKEVE